ncbi:hypothetical protein [Eubacterium sp. 1001713B170207_170306_E7]|uniref:hypothetical protein n=1 Tax=Eubacterium sp. 1001713B170207_170306_E7 TaxID=2787097 RepID=UPI00189AFABC|nr:hypothetical protein [Eubacterium sp. 1001713B170207_170306_E7]
MRSGQYALYHGETFKCQEIMPDTFKLIVDGNQAPPGFRQSSYGDFTKMVRYEDLEKIMQIKTMVVYRNENLTLLEEDEKRLLVATGDQRIGIRLGMTENGRGEFVLELSKSEPYEILESME